MQRALAAWLVLGGIVSLSILLALAGAEYPTVLRSPPATMQKQPESDPAVPRDMPGIPRSYLIKAQRLL